MRVPRIMLGAEALGGHDWGDLDIASVERAIESAIERGLKFFDVADCYGLGQAEARLGQIVKTKRDQVVIATKFGVRVNNGKTTIDTSPEYLQTALEASLRRLGTDTIDLYQVHWPDGVTPIGEVFDALERHRAAGKIRAFGVSNIPLSDVALHPLPWHLASFSFEYSLANRDHEGEIRKTLSRAPLSFLSWGTLGQGVLSGKYSETSRFAANDRRSKAHWKNFHNNTLNKNLQIVDTMRCIADELAPNAPPLTAIAIAWNLHTLPGSIAIAGAKNPAQVDENALALELTLPSWALDRLETVSAPSERLAEAG
ncbi:MAG: aldo/keto reductase [Pseudomonadota bacterium]